MTLAADTTAEYKGRTYRLAWAGDTKYGQRAKLQFFDGSKEFWVDYDKVRVLDGSQGHSHGHGPDGCAECGARRTVTTAPDSSGIMGPVCARCARMGRYERSY